MLSLISKKMCKINAKRLFSSKSLIFPYKLGNRSSWLDPPAIEVMDPQGPSAFVPILIKKGYMDGFKFAYSQFLKSIAFREEDELQCIADHGLLRAFEDGVQELEKMKEKIILKAQDGSIIQNAQHFDVIQESDNRYEVQARIHQIKLLLTPKWGYSIDKSKLRLVKNFGTMQHISIKGSPMEMLSQAMQQQISVNILFQITLEISSSLVLQSIPINAKQKTRRQKEGIKPELHYIQFEGVLKHIPGEPRKLFSQLFSKQFHKSISTVNQQNFNLEDILISDFDGFHKGCRWYEADQTQL